MSPFVNMPVDMIIEILSYDDIIRFRNGIFINRIPKNDPRRRGLETIPKPVAGWYTDINPVLRPSYYQVELRQFRMRYHTELDFFFQKTVNTAFFKI